MTNHDKPVAVVTGANRGIGRAIADGYVRAGYVVAVTARDANTCAGAVCPGAVGGPRFDAVVRSQAASRGITDDEARAAFTAPSPLGRVVDAAEVAAACTFLSSAAAASITGEDLNVNAGVAMF